MFFCSEKLLFSNPGVLFCWSLIDPSRVFFTVTLRHLTNRETKKLIIMWSSTSRFFSKSKQADEEPLLCLSPSSFSCLWNNFAGSKLTRTHLHCAPMNGTLAVVVRRRKKNSIDSPSLCSAVRTKVDQREGGAAAAEEEGPLFTS